MAEGRSNRRDRRGARRDRASGREARHLDLHEARPHARLGGPPAGARRAAVPAVPPEDVPAAAAGTARGARGVVRLPRLPGRAPDDEPTIRPTSAPTASSRWRSPIHHNSTARDMKDPLHWPPGAPFAFGVAAPACSVQRAEREEATTSAGLLGAGAGLARDRPGRLRDRRAARGFRGGGAAAALVGLYPPLILATVEQISEPPGRSG